jgi:betaine-aldehyde dehydrogenase
MKSRVCDHRYRGNAQPGFGRVGYRLGMTKASSWINGGAVATAGHDFKIVNPANGGVVAEYALATTADVDAAVAAARTALPGWATATPADRSAVLAKLAKLAGDYADELVAE